MFVALHGIVCVPCSRGGPLAQVTPDTPPQRSLCLASTRLTGKAAELVPVGSEEGLSPSQTFP